MKESCMYLKKQFVVWLALLTLASLLLAGCASTSPATAPAA